MAIAKKIEQGLEEFLDGDLGPVVEMDLNTGVITPLELELDFKDVLTRPGFVGFVSSFRH